MDVEATMDEDKHKCNKDEDGNNNMVTEHKRKKQKNANQQQQHTTRTWKEGGEEHDNKTQMDLDMTPHPVTKQDNDNTKMKSNTTNTEDKNQVNRKGPSTTTQNEELIQFEIEADDKGNVYIVLPEILENIKKTMLHPKGKNLDKQYQVSLWPRKSARHGGR